METKKKFVVSHAPHWHNGNRVSRKSYNMMLAALPAVAIGIHQYGALALGVVCIAMASAMAWELILDLLMKRPSSIGDGTAALTGLILAMLMPPTLPWWAVITTTFVAILIGKMIFGGLGGNPFNPVLVGYAVANLSWKGLFDFDAALAGGYTFGFDMAYPLTAVKTAVANGAGAEAAANFSASALLMGQQTGGIGAIFGLGLIIGGLYLIIRGYIRWEICLSFVAGIFVTAYLFKAFGPEGAYADPSFHLLTGFTLIGAFFLMGEDSSTPVNLIPMLIFGAGAGVLTMLMRNIGAYADGVVYAILLMNILNPLLDMIRPGALGKVVENA
ncbi:MAG: RnfABCDGE type electron transport complex subunit D [Desulfatibacillum sp.]|nr:RnfABCDGE type electron transport complex subunit D [Desulfatibacillum sp.]